VFLNHLAFHHFAFSNPHNLYFRSNHSESRSTYLILHNALLEPRSTHSNLPRLLTPTPNALVIRRLLRPQTLCIRYILLQHLVEGTLGRRGCDVGLGNVGLGGALDGVVGGHLVRGR
jgi:hypothetical protein